jgi:secretion/DNA translocation related TadE-like protein
VCLVLVVLAGVLIRIGAAGVARRKAETAADLGALAAAASVLRGEQVACAAAAEIVRRNGARLSSCVFEGMDARVVAAVDSAFLGGAATGQARAGPVGSG